MKVYVSQVFRDYKLLRNNWSDREVERDRRAISSAVMSMHCLVCRFSGAASRLPSSSANELASKPRQSTSDGKKSISRYGKGCCGANSTKTKAGEAENDNDGRCASLRLRHMYVSARSSEDKARGRLSKDQSSLETRNSGITRK